MLKMTGILTVICLAFSASAAFADRYFVENAKGSGVAESDREAVEELIRLSVSQAGGHTVAAKKEDAQFTLVPQLLKLGDSYVLSLQKRNKAGDLVFAEKMKATTMSDMDTVANRITRAVIQGSSTDDTADVTNITEEEENRNTRRYKATRQWVLGIGPGWATNLRSSGGGFTFQLGFLWGLDPDFGINLSMLTNGGRGDDDDSSFFDFSLGGEYYFNRRKHTPFAGLRLGYGSAQTSDSCTISIFDSCKQDKASGWGMTGTVGVKAFRTSTVNAAVMANYSYLFDRTTAGNPALLSVLLAVYY